MLSVVISTWHDNMCHSEILHKYTDNKNYEQLPSELMITDLVSNIKLLLSIFIADKSFRKTIAPSKYGQDNKF